MHKRLRLLQYFNAGSPCRAILRRGSAVPEVRVRQESHAGPPQRRPSTPRPARLGRRERETCRASERRPAAQRPRGRGPGPPPRRGGGRTRTRDATAGGLARRRGLSGRGGGGTGKPFKPPPNSPARWVAFTHGPVWRGGVYAAAYPSPRTPPPPPPGGAERRAGVRQRRAGDGGLESPYRHRATPPPRPRLPRRGPPRAAPPRRWTWPPPAGREGPGPASPGPPGAGQHSRAAPGLRRRFRPPPDRGRGSVSACPVQRHHSQRNGRRLLGASPPPPSE